MSLITEKLEQAKGLLKDYGVDCWITFVRESSLNGDPTLAYLVESSVTWHSAFVVAATGKTAAIVGSLDKAMIDDLKAYDRVEGYVTGFKEPFQALLRELNPRSIAVNYSTGSEICDGLTHGMYLQLHAYLADLGMEDRLMPAEKIISSLREQKTPREIAAMREAINRTLRIYRAAGEFIRPGMSEQEIASFIKARARESGEELAWDALTCPSVFTGPDTAGAHYGPTGRKVEGGHVLNMDFGLRYDGYCSDLQRTWYVRKPGESAAPPEVQRGFETIRRAIEDARKAMRPGVQGLRIDAIARGVITGEGYGEFPHGLGHQVGRFAHDGTALLGPAWEKYANKPFEPLKAGMVFTIEPRLTVPGHGVVTIEEMVQVTPSGAEYLSAPQETLYLV
ncbi:MAG TPA: Xaa-Pro peptidase family protein [Bacteroidota bacterium]